MGGTPTRHHTKSRRNKGRSHFALHPLNLRECPKCHYRILPHQVCVNCGYYKGKEEVDVMKKLDKKERKEREKVIAETEKK
ncbi:MAG: 50S ribosomal protein L32 [Candidatus Brennerbacteria bacterium CG11_big_fil_rev_8_21_14_0_20_43_10]|uniref:Large ribosomal subunit protein bL32 n=3 Tax=Candidatus Brenneribacteriota TaxID=1817902 RepID=A0A2M8C1M3_9BACT|nr:MAG: 50S ribosomal protein L32 [Parcubacteria group bacterium CG1_02_44_31]PIP50617.1 MAG: 50S ribosomal protein L32 [Candidatus Brennerbacteria bacterium CG23_combo_of_CG06-09_8_20_14_all_44_41]PIR25446.1 MAG: 50S ribosomal protein L32 [Candidatus Brennerbacteria bacterium CG11_big_fil_rev_8_21_14_0_20_43_10]PIX28911.1 MAG: 50S ribosomal protein L32 [Candidatus Brennerbacteria bacterium CG_4_8_14_3_um_filter_43_14]PJB49995.1 MAG: 50S ribosomal protein L32 [Candidatus Brennerbacteria bacteri